jgi:ribosomal protein S18 acetylase RimI-like enzyme
MELNNTRVSLIPDSQISSAGILLAEAFFADPLNQYVFPDPEERRQVLPWYFAASVREGAFLQGVYVTGEPIKGVAVWTPPGFYERMQERARHSGLDQMQRQFGPHAYQRFTGVINHLARFRSQVAPPAHWYLSLIGVSPSCQGQGIGGALLAPVLLKADKEGTCCFLETFEEKNLSFYQRHGFQVVAAEIEPYSQLRFWTMSRPPRTSP